MSEDPAEPEGASTGFLLLKAAGLGLFGLIAVPVLTFVVTLALAYALDDECGTSGDSGGCEMDSASIALAMAVPGFLLFFFVTLIRDLRRRAREPEE